MANEELVRYVQACLSRGYSYQQVRQALLQSGYTQPVIDEAFLDARRALVQPRQMQQAQQMQQPRSGGKKWLLMVIILVIAAMGYLVFFGDLDIFPKGTTTTTALATTRTFMPTTTTLLISEQGSVQFFEALLCNSIENFNCFENRYGSYERNESVYIYFKLFIDSKEMNPGSGLYKIGFIEDRKIIGPDGNAEEVSNLIDIAREVPDEGKYSIPAYNIIETTDDDLPGEYTVIITARDKYSDFRTSKEIRYKLT